MFLKNCWYALAWSHEVQGAGLLARKVIGQPLVAYRTEGGEAAVLIDRCSHRFAPLSLGRREGDTLRCMYHGLVFDTQGACVLEPGRKRPSPNMAIRSYPVVERYKLIWVWMGEPSLADPDLVPDCHWQDDPAWRSIPAYIHYKADYRLIMDNLLDFSHLSFVHENTLGGSLAIAETAPLIEQIDKTVRITRWYRNEPDLAPYLKGVAEIQGPIDRWNIYEWHMPGNVLNMDSGSAPAGTGAPEGHRVPEALQFHATQIVTPEDGKNSHFFWSYGHNFNLDDAVLTDRLAGRILEGFEEDKVMIEAQQLVIDQAPDDARMGYILVDAGLARGRRLLERLLAEEQQGLAVPAEH
ncbi:ring-hydroxylating dioxygenase, large terminal subunit [Caulobacter sp. AP07]|uniref:aromatic ring-hydroxylating dioxygenase subunit alpha n=1 Tax=Caulobacter sp. AP07 TaxID=1144304 RepID=UPI000271E853|nr:aromatic ring-hydroxylating dioxygenase subunit alpha [Caulobacter sp. AP07]EJL35974.1 ring-hydroxylating dioxygenase, large terminal subunit [Caulobacter sp. AP07]